MTYVGRGRGRRPAVPRTLLMGAVLALPVLAVPTSQAAPPEGVGAAAYDPARGTPGAPQTVPDGATRAGARGAVPPGASRTRQIRIRDIQGAGHVSPLNGARVTGVRGVVTTLTANGFWMQDPRPDRNDATSEGVFVYTRNRPPVTVADAVRVDGKVSEFRPGGRASANLGRTEIDATATAVEARGVPLPPPVTLGPKGRRPPGEVVDDDGRGLPLNVETAGVFDPRRDALDFYETLEGMRVRVQDAVAVGPSSDGQIPVLPAGGAGAGRRTARGGIVAGVGDANPERVVLDDALAPLPTVNVGDRLPGHVEGVLDYGYGTYTLLPTATPRTRSGGLRRETTRPQRSGELAVATLNVDGLAPSAPRERFRAVAADIVDGLRSPDLITVSGVRDNSGPDDDGTVAADQTVAELIAAISEAGGPAYDWRSVAPRDNADGGEEGSNDHVGFLFRTDRGLGFVDRPARGGGDGLGPAASPGGPDLTRTAVRALAEGGRARLSLSPGRVAPADPVWSNSRKPLAGEITWRGRRIIVVANHWYPKSGDDQPAFGRIQPPRRPSEWRRAAQGKVVARFVRSVRAMDGNADVIVAGSLNEPEFSVPVRDLAREAGLRNMTDELPRAERYTAVSSGNAQALDHIMLSPSLARRKHEYDVVHRRSEFADRPTGDRDPAVVRIDMSAGKPATAPNTPPGE
ncbi:endonuclease/exonuclease/phosphatase [Actinomadura sp. NPDC047616]|uniref:endonuclease/exonuclease/phosphatase n=1 Tax=Actinomadura sp. NPDC047616 TaxID=3155914 RepID=UPI00340AEEBB